LPRPQQRFKVFRHVEPARYCEPRLGGQGESLVPPKTRGSVSLTLLDTSNDVI
jgi:hypothetical protein